MITNVKIKELSRPIINSTEITVGRAIFMNYFLDLYIHESSQSLQITSEIRTYLTHIFDATEHILKTDPELYAIFAYLHDKPIGFCVFNALENKHDVLIRTLPIDLAYKANELDLRNVYVDYVRKKLPTTKRIIIMVRKANTHHQKLCLQAGFEENISILEQSDYLKNIYDQSCYIGYTKNCHTEYATALYEN